VKKATNLPKPGKKPALRLTGGYFCNGICCESEAIRASVGGTQYPQHYPNLEIFAIQLKVWPPTSPERGRVHPP
jgi:hypothetical protein